MLQRLLARLGFPRERGLTTRQLLQWLDGGSLGWVVLDRRGRVSHLNPRAERLLGLDVGRLLQGRSFELLCPDPMLQATVRSARRLDRPQRLEWSRGGIDIDVLAIPGQNGWLALQLQTRLTLEAQLREQERWVGDVAHELKTPLTALLLVGDSLAAQVNDRNARLVERLQRELLRLQELVSDLLELSRLENRLPGRGLRREAIEMKTLVEQVWTGLRPLADQHRVSLKLEAVSQPELWGDRSRLHRALLNLLDNALRYSPDAAELQVQITSRSGWCRIRVRDGGPGFSEQDLEHMFERFYRGDPARVKSQRTGSGLGLSIAQQIVTTHGGRIQASNHPDGGALLELILPLDGPVGGDKLA
ncbi:MAG: HAMP domain-containing sensor histidine kinase [Cyanobacteriota bacterium]|jgi:two-component system phosphate regulon sensor histidine kinase PhoR|nr:HAMP domain-containing sensor histidine kinase [Cyanobacteriota bacterium]